MAVMRKGRGDVMKSVHGLSFTNTHRAVKRIHSLSQHDETHNAAIFERGEEFAGLAAGWV
jgi:hypothetical protein